MTKNVGLSAKTYSYLIDDGSEDKKAKGTKTCVIKRKLKFGNCKNCLEMTQLENKIHYLEKYKTGRKSKRFYKKIINEHEKYSKSIKLKGQRFHWRNQQDCFKFKWW